MFSGEAGAIADAREGMHVVDAVGKDLGTVSGIRMGDPSAVTSAGQAMEIDEPYLDGETPDLPPMMAERLMRTGFLHVSRKGLFRGDFYVAAEEIDNVDTAAGAVKLRVAEGDLSTGA